MTYTAPIDATHRSKTHHHVFYKIAKNKNGINKVFRWSDTYPVWDAVALVTNVITDSLEVISDEF